MSKDQNKTHGVLKPCPFCGCAPDLTEVMEGGVKWIINCPDCPARMVFRSAATTEAAVERWNDRRFGDIANAAPQSPVAPATAQRPTQDYLKDALFENMQRVDDKEAASRLAMRIWDKHYRKEAPCFELCESLAGILSQIDNMVSGLSRQDAPTVSEASITREHNLREIIAGMIIEFESDGITLETLKSARAMLYEPYQTTPPTSAALPGSLDGIVCEHCGEGHTELTFADGQFAVNCDNCSADCLHFTVEHLNSVLPPTSAADEAIEQRDIAIQMLAEWCCDIDRNGTGWDDWDENYKNAKYRPGPLRNLLDAAIASTSKESGDE